jgi:ATP-dependent exoDNAse (exonuclease V) beta subunit
VQIRLAAMPEGRRVGLARAAPSSLEGGSVLAMENLLRVGNRGAMARGTLIHAWFEQIQWLDEHRPTELQLRRAAERLDLEGISVEAALQDFSTYLAAPSVSELLTRSSYLELLRPSVRHDLSDPPELVVFNERRFAVHAAMGILAGTIDRLVLVRHRGEPLAADVIDYKTDLIDEENAQAKERLLKHYAPQLQAYRIAVGKMFGLDTERVSARIVLLSRGEVAELSSQNT